MTIMNDPNAYFDEEVGACQLSVCNEYTCIIIVCSARTIIARLHSQLFV